MRKAYLVVAQFSRCFLSAAKNTSNSVVQLALFSLLILVFFSSLIMIQSRLNFVVYNDTTHTQPFTKPKQIFEHFAFTMFFFHPPALMSPILHETNFSAFNPFIFSIKIGRWRKKKREKRLQNDNLLR